MQFKYQLVFQKGLNDTKNYINREQNEKVLVFRIYRLFRCYLLLFQAFVFEISMKLLCPSSQFLLVFEFLLRFSHFDLVLVELDFYLLEVLYQLQLELFVQLHQYDLKGHQHFQHFQYQHEFY